MDVEGATSPLAELLFGERHVWGRMQKRVYGTGWQTVNGDETAVKAVKKAWIAMRPVCRKASTRMSGVFWVYLQIEEFELMWKNSVLNAVDRWQEALSVSRSIMRTGSRITINFVDPIAADDFMDEWRELSVVFSGMAIH